MISQRVRSQRDHKLVGKVIGEGLLWWPGSDEPATPIWMIQIDERGSSALGPAVAVWRKDMTEEA